ncbi:lytic transglycosylase domain-containing protein [Flectobacillus roseus]
MNLIKNNPFLLLKIALVVCFINQLGVADAQSTLPKTVLPKLPTQLSFAGETVPLNDPIVMERLEKELIKNVYKQSATLMVLKRVGRYKQTILEILKKNQIPDDFFYLAVIESDLSPIAESGKALGFWQFRETTANEFGLETSKYVDERRHLSLSTKAACKFFNSLYKSFNNWTLCAAAFNGGRRAIQENLKAQNTNSFYDLYLNPETYDYVFRILAMKLICEHPEEYGFIVNTKEYEEPTKEVIIENDINLVDFARKYNISYNKLKYYNPWLLYRSAWEATDKYVNDNKTMNLMLEVPVGKTYTFLVPVNSK